MTGTSEGAKKGALKLKATYGEDYYSKIGSKGGSYQGPKGFGTTKVGEDGLTGRERAAIAGKKSIPFSKMDKKV